MNRLHYFDLIRALLMVAGIPYHASLIYRPEFTWQVSSAETSGGIAFLGSFLHTFRMPAFFIIAGYFSILLLRRRGTKLWLKNRFLRLGVPLVSCMVLLTPVQTWLTVLHSVTPFDWKSSVILAAHEFATRPSRWMAHLWFLADLLVMALLLGVAWRFRERVRWYVDLLTSKIAALSPCAVLLLFAGLGFWSIATFAGSRLVQSNNFLISALFGVINVPRVFHYLPYFGFGLLLGYSPRLLAAVTCPSRSIWLVGFSTALLGAFVSLSSDLQWKIVALILLPVSSVGMTHVLLSAAATWFNHPRALVRRAVDLSFTVYIVHQPAIIAVGLILVESHMNAWISFIIVVTLALCISFALAAIVARSSLLLFLFNGVLSNQLVLPQHSASVWPARNQPRR